MGSNYGIVDIGSNTIPCNVYHVRPEQGFQLLFSKKYTAGLASYIDDKELTRKGINKLLRILRSIQLMTNQVDLEDLFVFATASVRSVANSKSVLKEVEDETGIKIDLLSQKDEALLGFLGILHSINIKKGISCDIGGGSTEIVLFDRGKEKEIVNLEHGSLSTFRMFSETIIPSREAIRQMKHFIREELSDEKSTSNYSTIVGIGGSVRAARNVIQEIYDLPKEEGFTVEMAKKILSKLKDGDRETIRTILKIAPDRIHTFTPGLIILLEICRHFDIEQVEVCDYGLREGYLIKKMEEKGERI